MLAESTTLDPIIRLLPKKVKPLKCPDCKRELGSLRQGVHFKEGQRLPGRKRAAGPITLQFCMRDGKQRLEKRRGR